MRTLALKKETLAELTDGELGDIAGASFPTKYNCTESYQVCNPLSIDLCVQVISLRPCLPTYTCFATVEC